MKGVDMDRQKIKAEAKRIIKGNLLDLSFNSNATHIIKRLLSNITTNKRKYLVKFLLSHLLILRT